MYNKLLKLADEAALAYMTETNVDVCYITCNTT